jgi:hypothetical protein
MATKRTGRFTKSKIKSDLTPIGLGIFKRRPTKRKRINLRNLA